METIDYRMKYIEEKIHGHDDRIKGLEQLSNEFTKISLILEQQIVMNKEQNVTMEKINDNLTNLNNTTQRLGERVGELEGQVKEVKKNDTILVSGVVRKVGWTLFTLIVGGLFTWGFAKLKGQQ